MAKSLVAMRDRLVRRKPFSDVSEQLPITSELKKCLTTLDLVSLGVGSCIGTGMYVVAGLVAHQMAGPGVIFSFLIAGIASLLSGICYAEFGVRAPKTTGSAYMYSYLTVGELFAFVIGWNLILEYMIGTAAGASALSSLFDSLSHHAISHFMHDIGAGTQAGRGFPDVVAFVIVIAMTILLATGVQTSVWFNNTLNLLNVAVWLFIVICSFWYINPELWETEGLLPFGMGGVFSGAATCFYAFIGFDIIATTGEESKNPSKSIPIAIILTLIICLVAYESCSVIVTLMVPYQDIDPESSLTAMFVERGANSAKYFVAVGAVASLIASLLGSQFPMARIIYAMAQDGLLFPYFNSINSFTGTPLIATLVSGFAAAILALLISLQALIEMMSIGTLLAYTLVSLSVLILRYSPDRPGTLFDEAGMESSSAINYGTQNFQPLHKLGDEASLINEGEDGNASKPGGNSKSDDEILPKPVAKCYDAICNLLEPHWRIIALRIGIPDKTFIATEESSTKVSKITILLAFDFLFLHLSIVFGIERTNSWWPLILVALFSFLGILLIYLILREPQNPRRLRFMAPWVPILPVAALFSNVYLILKLNVLTWIRFVVWLLIGAAVYFGYGMWNSKQESSQKLTEDEKQGVYISTLGVSNSSNKTQHEMSGTQNSLQSKDQNMINAQFYESDQHTSLLSSNQSSPS